MSCILYYSNYCESCKKIIGMIARTSMKDDMHFLCIDNRIKKNNGATYLQLDKGQEVILPPTVTKVPALLLINRGYKVLFGNEIVNMIEPNIEVEKQAVVEQTGEPMAFQLGSINYGVSSDQYSFLDQNAEDLSAKGNGGMRQIHHYSSINSSDCIETPPDNYQPDKIGDVSLEKLQSERENNL